MYPIEPILPSKMEKQTAFNRVNFVSDFEILLTLLMVYQLNVKEFSQILNIGGQLQIVLQPSKNCNRMEIYIY